MRTTSAAVAAALVLVGLGSVPGARATDRAATSVPNPCKSFTTRSIDNLLGVPTTVRPTRHLAKHGAGTQYESNRCKVTYKSRTVYVDMSNYAPGGGGGYKTKTYKRPKLGQNGRVTVSQPPEARTSATYEKHGIFVVDELPGRALPHKGRAMYRFALAQSKRLKHV